MKKKALGKGISALIPEKEISTDKNNINGIRTELISTGRFQPRMSFDPVKHIELVASIKEKGIMQPVIVRPVKGGEGFELIAGERRLRAARELKLQEIPAIIKNVKDAEALELSLIENIQREELNPIEEAHAYKRLMEEFGLTQDEAAKRVGRERPTVANTLRLLSLPTLIQDYVSRGTLSMGHARALLGLEDNNKRISLSEKIAKRGLSVREVESIVKRNSNIYKPRHRKDKNPRVKAAEEELQTILGTKVTIINSKKRGKIQIEYYTLNDMERVLNILKKK